MPTDLVETAGAGITCGASNAEALADAMSQMSQRLDLDPAAFRTGRAFVAAHYDRRTLAKQFGDVLTEALARCGR